MVNRDEWIARGIIGKIHGTKRGTRQREDRGTRKTKTGKQIQERGTKDRYKEHNDRNEVESKNKGEGMKIKGHGVRNAKTGSRYKEQEQAQGAGDEEHREQEREMRNRDSGLRNLGC